MKWIMDAGSSGVLAVSPCASGRAEYITFRVLYSGNTPSIRHFCNPKVAITSIFLALRGGAL